ncbi:cupin [Streptomyces sp. NPDC126503]|uniref:cupin n=1 Tax=Streptomyces sp. NPDC126503 TaxID=3155315 RepID=UPI00331F7645
MTVTPIDLSSFSLHIRPDARVRAEQPVFDPERDGRQLMTFHVETDADVHGDHGEIHTEADEVVSCLDGGIRLLLRPERPGDQEEAVALTPGTAVIVPRGPPAPRRPGRPSDVMSLTLPHGSRPERRTEA